MTKTDIAKKAINLAVTTGTGKIIGTIIKNNVQPDNAIDTITVAAGSIALGGLVAAETSKYTDAQIDELVSWWKANVTKS